MHIWQVTWARSSSKLDWNAWSCWTAVSESWRRSTVVQRSLTSPASGFGASSAFLDAFCRKLSLLGGRVGLSLSPALADGRLPVGVVPRGARELEAMAGGCFEEPGVCEEAREEDDVEGRVFAGGVMEERSMAAAEVREAPTGWRCHSDQTRR